MKAYVYSNGSASVKTVPVPEIQPNQVLVRVRAAAMNPTDWKHIRYRMYEENQIAGADLSGEIVKVGSEVQGAKVGDCLFAVWGGAFCEYIALQPGMYFSPNNKKLTHSTEDEIPAGTMTTFETASSAGVAILTCGLAFGHYAGLRPLAPNPELKDKVFLVWGASSSLGQMVVQFARYYGFEVVATCSSYNFEHVKSLGADHVFDYKDSDVIEKIRKVAGDRITISYDTVVAGNSAPSTYELMSNTEPALMMTSLDFVPTESDSGVKNVKSNVQVEFPLGYFVAQDKKVFVSKTYYRPEGLVPHYIEWVTDFNKLLANDAGFVKHIPVKVLPNGFDSIQEGLDTLEGDKNKGVKIVVRLD